MEQRIEEKWFNMKKFREVCESNNDDRAGAIYDEFYND